MDPRTGEYVTDVQWNNLAPEERERFSVRLEGKAEDIERISNAVAGKYTPTVEELNAGLMDKLRQALTLAKKWQRSGNPGRKAAGVQLEELLG